MFLRVYLEYRAGDAGISSSCIASQTSPTQGAATTQQRCVNAQGFSLHAEVCCATHQRKKLESQGQELVRAPAEGWPGPKAACLARRATVLEVKRFRVHFVPKEYWS